MKFEDVNGNGARDPFDVNGDGTVAPGDLEPGLPNWEIRLLDSTGSPVRDAQKPAPAHGSVRKSFTSRADVKINVTLVQICVLIESALLERHAAATTITGDPPL